MKTTPEQRRAWKEKRRFKGWRNLLACMERRIRRSQRTLEVSKKAVEEIQKSQCLQQIQEAIRLAN